MRYRLHEAVERLKGPKPPSLAALAADLGYTDQAHFARNFKAVVGRTTAEFARDRSASVSKARQ
jgi:AraC-like DNA-binding protein